MGSVNRSTFEVNRSGSKTTIAPTAITASCRTMSPSASTISGPWRTCPVKPAMFTPAANTITAAAAAISAHPCVKPSQIGLR